MKLFPTSQAELINPFPVPLPHLCLYKYNSLSYATEVISTHTFTKHSLQGKDVHLHALVQFLRTQNVLLSWATYNPMKK